ncbi:hypothetical protein B0T21DRAFT_385130 [Apiosordaria backusii]|uniref:Uncharacterized protein n=1 Tax=Apiosordaria backusii TaxID=314023 RepID=A0AA40E6P7_9PEZI|nr:hypothetical protein B0T21DRAFT_385130 [Apiosordaria backusii]
MAAPEVSHGRGGAGNINPDDTKYVDGEVVRVGPEGSHGDGAFSTGRGGAANIADPGKKQTVRADKDLIPEAAIRPSQDTDYHTGRGGAGNEHKDPSKEHAKKVVNGETNPVGLADRLKHKILGIFKK